MEYSDAIDFDIKPFTYIIYLTAQQKLKLPSIEMFYPYGSGDNDVLCTILFTIY